ncbi:50S ribosomal protein L11 methyltransferase [Cucumibacter marinus]|uniref:50S ribosomal protein L11 methyltransferase n=1 Tax=Cucumibacter marinus TaxID=1121252 RepID=UPI0004240483|nr:50S ribosomal protein L11 methyltransferase [Cucumibacter marinus]
MPLHTIAAPLPQHLAYAMADALDERGDLALSASAFETDDGSWMFQAMTEGLPDYKAFTEIALSVLGRELDFIVEPVPDIDWVSRSLEGLSPVSAGGFYVYGSHEKTPPPAGSIPILIDAGQAFGTGHHETTAGCLEALGQLIKQRRPRTVLDLGCGTGVLAIAAAKALKQPVLATDIDPIAIEVTDENAKLNEVAHWVRAETAPGMHHPVIAGSAPYDLILANILAGPLCDLAPAIARHAAHGATIILSGLLNRQATRVINAYAMQGVTLKKRVARGEWATLILERN